MITAQVHDGNPMREIRSVITTWAIWSLSPTHEHTQQADCFCRMSDNTNQHCFTFHCHSWLNTHFTSIHYYLSYMQRCWCHHRLTLFLGMYPWDLLTKRCFGSCDVGLDSDQYQHKGYPDGAMFDSTWRGRVTECDSLPCVDRWMECESGAECHGNRVRTMFIVIGFMCESYVQIVFAINT